MPQSLEDLFPSFEDSYKKTRDYRYVLLAIGEHPSDPPRWALKVCTELLEQYQIAVDPFDQPRKGGPKRKSGRRDGELLLQVARLIYFKGASKTAAIQEVTGEDADGATFKRLMRTWNKASHLERFALPHGREGRPTSGSIWSCANGTRNWRVGF